MREITLKQVIDGSRRNIERAEYLLESRQNAAKYARETYKGLRLTGGEYMEFQAKARKVLKLAAEYGITKAKPYFIKGRMVYGFFGFNICPLWGK